MIVGLTEVVMSLFPTSYITFVHQNFVSTGYFNNWVNLNLL